MNKKFLLALLSTATISAAIAAPVGYYSSNENVLKADYHTATPKFPLYMNNISGAGLELNGVFGPSPYGFEGTGKRMAIAKVLDRSGVAPDNYTPAAKVWNISGNDVANAIGSAPTSTINNHADIMVQDSHLTIGRVGNGNYPVNPVFHSSIKLDDGVYFGVWHRKSGTALSPATVTTTFGAADAVFYSGVGATTNITTNTDADYDVVGLTHKNVTPENQVVVSEGVFTAKFSLPSPTLAGNLSNGLTLGTVDINKSTGSFSGDATFSGSTGDVNGQFYNGIDKLAGVAEFGSKFKDTAFGGKKQ